MCSDMCGVPLVWLSVDACPFSKSDCSCMSLGPSRNLKACIVHTFFLKKSINRGSKRCMPYNSFLMSAGFGVTATVMVHNKWRCKKVQFD